MARGLTLPDVIEMSADLFVERGNPEHIRSDGRPEFRAKALREWLVRLDVGALFIEPRRPWENACRSFNDKLRDELLNCEILYTPQEAKILIGDLRSGYNTIRPHSSLAYSASAPEIRTPIPALTSIEVTY